MTGNWGGSGEAEGSQIMGVNEDVEILQIFPDAKISSVLDTSEAYFFNIVHINIL
jgi:hypothetical protein